MRFSAADIEQIKIRSTPAIRKARSISLDDEKYLELKALCMKNGWQINLCLDALIQAFLEGNK